MKEPRRTLVLLDAHAILHRAYHALPDFSTRAGEPTGALYGLSTMLMKIINELKPDYLVACYDLPEPTYRHEAYEQYKATRVKADPNLIAQLNSSRDVFTAFHIPMYEKPGFEADDILGTIAATIQDPQVEVVIASGDMDTLQLVDGTRVRVYTLRKGIQDTVMYDEQGVKDRFGFPPKLLPDYKGLRGDPSDNIPGIPGIGEKTAAEIIQKFGTIESLYKTLKKDPEALTKAGIKPRMVELLKSGKEEAEFSKMLATIRRDAPIDFVLPARPWREEVSIKDLQDLFERLEFRSLATRAKDMFAQNGVPADILAAEHSPEQLSTGPLPDARVLRETAVALWLLDSTKSDASLEDILHFAKTDNFETARDTILAELQKKSLTKVFADIEQPLLPVVAAMEARGVRIDTAYLKKLSADYHRELDAIAKRVYQHAGQEFNINSPKQLSEILFEKLALTIKNHKKTEGGVKSTRESELEKLREAHPIVGEVLSYRELQKLLSTYIDVLPELADSTGRVHARFLQDGTTTGRMSSQNPNLQNIPIKTEQGRNIRRAFIAERGFRIVAFDYSQIELRVAAFLSGDKKLIEIFQRGGDVHAAVAAQVFGVSEAQVDREMRRQAKVINFGILYGMGINALRQSLGGSRAEAQKFYNDYFNTFTGLAKYLDRVKAETERRGYTETLFGRRRYFEGFRSPLPYIRASAERMAINAPIQGTQADIIKLAMIAVDRELKEQNFSEDVHLILQVHDELVYEVRAKKLDEVAARIRKTMETILPLLKTSGIPLSAKASAGENWADMQEIE